MQLVFRTHEPQPFGLAEAQDEFGTPQVIPQPPPNEHVPGQPLEAKDFSQVALSGATKFM